MSTEKRALLDREKRALAAEARIKNSKQTCASCSNSLNGLQPFDKNGLKYCSMNCLKQQQSLHS
jgi:hypothetical protein